MKLHYTELYLLNPPHQVSVDLVGMGGTGSQVLSGLARINESLIALGHPGIHVRCWDDDVVTTANIGRQLFSTADLGLNKAVVLVTRVNRFFGYQWEGRTEAYGGHSASNILITCVDSARARIMIGKHVEGKEKKRHDPTDTRYYWLDLGNTQKSGQCVIGTIRPVKQPNKRLPGQSTTQTLPTVTKKFPQLMKMYLNKKDDDTGPSCSLAEALEKQDLFINSTLAQFGCNLLWKLLREGVLRYQGCYVNLEAFSVNPIKI